MQQLTANQVGQSQVRSLADLGFKTGRDGSLSIDTLALERALKLDPAGVDAVFSTATTGVAAAASALAESYTDASDGVLTLKSKSLSSSVSRLGDRIDKAQLALDKYRDLLTAQYTAMEKVVGGLKSIGNFLSMQEQVQNKR
jgi:flagellar hook-associated protein 2